MEKIQPLETEKSPRKRGFFANFGIGREKDYFVENLAVLLNSGMDILSAVQAIKVEIRSQKMKQIIAELEDEIEGGSTLWQSLSNSAIAPPHIIYLIKLGEESGRLPENLGIVAEQTQKDRELRSKIRSAMIYPVIVFTLTFVIGLGIAWFVLPRLAVVFSQLKLELPVLTKGIILLGNFLKSYGSLSVPLFLGAIIVLLYFLFFNPKTKFLGSGLLFALPGTKRLIQEIELTRFGFVLGTLLGAGLLVTSALSSLKEATALRPYQKLYLHLKNNLEEGIPFRGAFSSFKGINRLVPSPIQQMIAAGEESGKLSDSLLKIGEIFEKKASNTTKNLAVILEPVLLVIVWLGVLAVALSVILPIYSLIGGLNQ